MSETHSPEITTEIDHKHKVQQSSAAKALDAAGPFLRDIVFGVHDALLTNIGVVAGFIAALQNNRLIITAALIDVIISAFAMAFGTYLSRTSESDYLKEQLSEHHHKTLQETLANPVTAAVVMWVTYVISGLIPLIPFLFQLTPLNTLRAAISLSLAVFFLVGYFKGIITRTNPWKSGLQFISFGGFAAIVGYIIGMYGQRFTGSVFQ